LPESLHYYLCWHMLALSGQLLLMKTSTNL
jgi:hypothetical protein